MSLRVTLPRRTPLSPGCPSIGVLTIFPRQRTLTVSGKSTYHVGAIVELGSPTIAEAAIIASPREKGKITFTAAAGDALSESHLSLFPHSAPLPRTRRFGEARMHTVEMLEQALDLATRLGYTIRQEWLAGSGGGGCELKGRKLFFLDLDLGPGEQLEQALEALRRESHAVELPMPRELGELLKIRKIA
jgi:hypothetical protein